MRKYTQLPLALMEERLAFPNSFILPEMATVEQLSTAHCPLYIEAVLNGSLGIKAQKKIGFEWTIDVANRARASAGGTLLAAKLALDKGAAANTAGGSHHASYDSGSGFCVFNDVAVAAGSLLASQSVERILVVDLDVHHGDGTARIFAKDDRVFTFSMHCEDNWPREKPASDFDLGVSKGMEDEAYLSNLHEHLERLIKKAKPEIVFYNAGVDPHVDDRLGLLNLTDEGIDKRDRYVAQTCKQHNLPIVGVLGGGYSKNVDDVVRRHVSMFCALSEVEY